MADIFISYAREDRALATRIATFLIARGISVWLDRELTAGERFSAVVQDALAQARAVVVLWSSHSVKSHWVNAEATEALKHDKLIPLLLDDSEPPLEFKNVHTLFVGAWLANANDAAGADLIRAIGKRTQLGTTVSTGASAAPIVSELRSRLQAVDTLRDLREGLHQAESYLAQNSQDTTARLLLHDYKEAIDSRTGTRVPQRSLTRLGVQKWLVASISVVLVAVLAVVIGIRVLKGTSPHNALSLAPAVSASKTASSLIPDTEKAFFFDDFSGGQLDPRWKIRNHNPGKTAVQPKKGTLLIVTEKGSIARIATNLRNQYILDIDLPKGNYEVIAKASLQIQSTHNSISLGLFRDDDNFLELVYWGRPASPIMYPDGVDSNFYRIVSFVKEDLGRRTAFSTKNGKEARGPRKEPFHFVFKMERNGNEYSGYFAPFSTERPPESLDQIRWRRLGTHAWIDFDGKLSLWARNGNSNIHEIGPPPEVAAEFDFVLIRAK